jgi:hypothetical protein
MPLLKHLHIGKSHQGGQSHSVPNPAPSSQRSSQAGPNGTTETKPASKPRSDSAPIVPSPISEQKGQSKPGNTPSSAGSSFLAHAEATLKEAAENLQKKLPKGIKEDERFQIKPIHGSADINMLSESLERSIGGLMDQEAVPERKQTLVKILTNNWVKKAIPFIHSGLSVAEASLLLVSSLNIIGHCSRSLRTCSNRSSFHSRGIQHSVMSDRLEGKDDR